MPNVLTLVIFVHTLLTWRSYAFVVVPHVSVDGKGVRTRQPLALVADLSLGSGSRRRRQSAVSRTTLLRLTNDDGDEDEDDDEDSVPENPYADPNYPDLEFVNYDDPEYQVDQGDEYFSSSSSQDGDDTEEKIEEMREDRRRRNDEFQFQTYFAETLKHGDTHVGEWTVYLTTTFLDDIEDNEKTANGGIPRLVKAARPISVASKAFKIQVDSDSEFAVDAERICHEQVILRDVLDGDPFKVWNDEAGNDDNDDDVPPEVRRMEEQFVAQRYWPEHLSAFDFRGQQGIMCVGNAYTICTAIPMAEKDEAHVGPFSEYRTEFGIQEDGLRLRIKLDYSIKEEEASEKAPALHLKSMIVCREAQEDWQDGQKRRSVADRYNTESLFGNPGAPGGLYDPPPVGCEEQAGRYMMLDLEGGATVLFPYVMDQDNNAFDGNGWVSSLDWTPGSIRYQVDRKVAGGKDLLGLRTLELSEVQSVDAETYRPRDGGADMRQ